MSDILISAVGDIVARFHEQELDRLIDEGIRGVRDYNANFQKAYDEFNDKDALSQCDIDHFNIQARALYEDFSHAIKEKKENYDQCSALSLKALLQRAADSYAPDIDPEPQPMVVDAPIGPSPPKKPRPNPVAQLNGFHDQAPEWRSPNQHDKNKALLAMKHDMWRRDPLRNHPRGARPAAITSPPKEPQGDTTTTAADEDDDMMMNDGDIRHLFGSPSPLLSSSSSDEDDDEEEKIEEWSPSDSDTDGEGEAETKDAKAVAMNASGQRRRSLFRPRHTHLGKRKRPTATRNRGGMRWTATEEAKLLKIMHANPQAPLTDDNPFWQHHIIPGRTASACVNRVKIFRRDGRI